MSSVTDIDRATRRAAPAKQSRGRRTRGLLLDVGLRLMENRDYDQFGVADVVAAAGSSTGAFYHHFADKDAYIAAVVDAVIERLWQRFEAEFGAEVLAPLPTAALLGRAVEFIRAIMRDNQGLIRTTFRKSLDDPEAWAPVRAFGRAYQTRIAELLAARAGDLGRPDWQDGFRFGMQMTYATLFNAIVNRPGPLAIEDPAMVDELTRMLNAYLQVRAD